MTSQPDTDKPDYATTYDTFWKDIVENPDGTLNMDQLQRELFDYHAVMRQVSEVYCHITNGRISKVNTSASAVIAVADDCTNELVAEAAAERLAKDAAKRGEADLRRIVRHREQSGEASQ